MIDSTTIEKLNAPLLKNLQRQYTALTEELGERGINIDQIKRRISRFTVAVPSWGVGTGGTRFARFPGPGEPRDIMDKLDDCGVINQLTKATSAVSLHIPWDKAEPAKLRAKAESLGLHFDAMNSNTFQDQPTQQHSYKFGSLSHTNAATRQQAIDHNIECIEIGQAIGSTALTVWIGDGSNFPGQVNFADQLERYLDSMKAVYKALPADWQIYTEHKIYEPAFYSTVVQDWGSSYLIAKELGPQASCLVDLGHHAPTVNIEMIVSRLIQFGKLGGFHYNDSKYGDDDLDSGVIDPYRLFLVFNELVDAELHKEDFNPAHMLDQSHNITDPIESLMASVMEVQRAFTQALIVDRSVLKDFQQDNDALMASNTLKQAYRTDVEPLLAMVRMEGGGAIDPVATFRQSGYRGKIAGERPAVTGQGGGIV